MNSLIESLESRTFLSVAPAVGELKADGKVIAAESVALHKVARANYRIIQADLRAAQELQSSHALVRTLTVESTTLIASLTHALTKTHILISTDVTKLVLLGNMVARHPTNITFQAKEAAIINKLQLDASNQLMTIDADLVNLHVTDEPNLTALETANPSNTKLASDDANFVIPDSTLVYNALANAATTALTTGVDDVIAAYTV